MTFFKKWRKTVGLNIDVKAFEITDLFKLMSGRKVSSRRRGEATENLFEIKHFAYSMITH